MPKGLWQDSELTQLLNGYTSTFLLGATMKLRLLEAIGDSTVTTAELASITSTHAPTLTRVLRALAALEILIEERPDTYRLAARGRLLLPDTPGSVHELATYLVDDWTWGAWPALDQAIRTGKLASEFAADTGWQDIDWTDSSEMRDSVDRLMIEHTRAIAPIIVDSYDFGPFSTVVDIGGGSGPFVATALAAHSHLRGILLDREDGVRHAPQVLAEAGVADRCEIRTGDFFESLPSGDLYFCKSVIFNWPEDERVAMILANCRKSMLTEHGRLLLVEQMLPAAVDGSIPPSVYLDDVGSVVNLGGRLRTEPEYRALLDSAGFTLTVHPLPTAPDGFVLLEAAPA
ncbi:O-methyltransferase [Tamaricihabitans halophyticus]|uniref:O-methyltransferase n=1 Tax=Tamaricihabitans halophyticus TaxID=1262583 RepID=A0A4R2Q0Q1_9PSEU|nr:methyltransferase [Tamaricihabitans halophyticus]TCP42050.1 O-methyltransferase [Tamaricihabitans halophyticus]